LKKYIRSNTDENRNLMLYGKSRYKNRFEPMDVKTGEFVGCLAYASLIPYSSLEWLKTRVRTLNAALPDMEFEIRYAGTNRKVSIGEGSIDQDFVDRISPMEPEYIMVAARECGKQKWEGMVRKPKFKFVPLGKGERFPFSKLNALQVQVDKLREGIPDMEFEIWDMDTHKPIY